MARYVVGSRLVANTAVAGIVLWGAYRVAGGTLALGVLAAAVLYLRRLYDPIDRLGMFLNSYQSAAASLEKIAGLLAQTPSVPEPPRPGSCRPCESRPPRPRGRLRRGPVRLPHRRRGAAPLRPDAPGRADGRGRRLHRRGQVDAGQAARPVLRPLRRPGPARRRRPARAGRARTAARGGDGDAGGVPVLRHGRREHRHRPPGRHPRGDRAGREGDRRARLHQLPCPTATTPTSASGAAVSPPVSANSWRSPGRCSPTRRC